jgi:hypothetical protein
MYCRTRDQCEHAALRTLVTLWGGRPMLWFFLRESRLQGAVLTLLRAMDYWQAPTAEIRRFLLFNFPSRPPVDPPSYSLTTKKSQCQQQPTTTGSFPSRLPPSMASDVLQASKINASISPLPSTSGCEASVVLLARVSPTRSRSEFNGLVAGSNGRDTTFPSFPSLPLLPLALLYRSFMQVC